MAKRTSTEKNMPVAVPQRATLMDVAKLAGVSRQVAGSVLNGAMPAMASMAHCPWRVAPIGSPAGPMPPHSAFDVDRSVTLPPTLQYAVADRG